MEVDAETISKLVALEDGLAQLEARESRRMVTDYDWEAGWRDDFFGHTLRSEYDQRTVGALSSIALEDGAHGGVVRLTSGNVLSDYARIMLGDRNYLFDSLDPDERFWLGGIFQLSHITSILVDLFVNAPINELVHIAADTDQGPNWYLRTDVGTGVDNWVNSGVPIDTNKHEHWLEMRSGWAGHWLDNVLINETTVKIPAIAMTANFRCLSRAAASRYGRLDFFAAIPMRSRRA